MIYLENPSVLLLTAPAWLAYRRWCAAQGVRAFLRLAMLVTLLMMASGPTTDAPDPGSTVVLVIDRSRSMPTIADRRASDILRQVTIEQGPAGRLAVVGFGAEPLVEQFPLLNHPPETSLKHVDPEQSNLHAAVARALELIPTGQRGRLLVLSDGLADDSLSEELAGQIRSRGVHIGFSHLTRRLSGDVVLEDVRGPLDVERGAEVVFELIMTAAEPAKGFLRVARDGVELSSEPIELDTGRTERRWSERLDESGVVRYSFQIDVNADPTPENNRWETWVRTRGLPTLLVLNADARETPLVELARQSGFIVRVARADQADMSLERLSGYQGVVLENEPADQIGLVAAQTIVRYVEQLGGGLVIAGGEKGLGADGYRFSPLQPLMPVALRGLGASERPAQALVVLVEPSTWETGEWLKGEDITSLQKSVLALTHELDTADRIGVLTTRTPDPVVVPLTSVTRPRDLRDSIASIGLSNDSGAFPRALKAAWDMLGRAGQPAKHLDS